jgi:RND family efflux transporter MFP subunit
MKPTHSVLSTDPVGAAADGSVPSSMPAAGPAVAKKQRLTRLWAVGSLLAGLGLAGVLAMQVASAQKDATKDSQADEAAAKAALTVTLTQAQRSTLPTLVVASGNVAAWQEAVIGAESNGLRLAEVRVNVGDVVRRGQVLATFSADLLRAETLQIQASLSEAEAMLAQAGADAQRARELQATGALSAQQINQLLTAERTAQARLEAQRALVKVQQLRLAQTQVVAPDSGVISARSATVGAVVPVGMELFRLVRQGRLEWRAEVAASDLVLLKKGQKVQLNVTGLPPIAGKVRVLAPTVDATTRNGLVYVDLPQPGALKAGMFARGDFEVGSSEAMTLPQTAVLLRDGFSYAFVVGDQNRVQQRKISVGRRLGDRIEVSAGLQPGDRVVSSGGGFLADGDTVRVVPAVKPQ